MSQEQTQSNEHWPIWAWNEVQKKVSTRSLGSRLNFVARVQANKYNKHFIASGIGQTRQLSVFHRCNIAMSRKMNRKTKTKCHKKPSKTSYHENRKNSWNLRSQGKTDLRWLIKNSFYGRRTKVRTGTPRLLGRYRLIEAYSLISSVSASSSYFTNKRNYCRNCHQEHSHHKN